MLFDRPNSVPIAPHSAPAWRSRMQFTLKSTAVACVAALSVLTLSAGSASAVTAHVATPSAGIAAHTSTVTALQTAAAKAMAAVPLSTPTKTALDASFAAKLPALDRALAGGASLSKAVSVAGYPAMTPQEVHAASVSAGAQPNGADCQDWTCGWKFSAQSTYEMEWLVWAGTIVGPGSICLLFGAETAGIACTVAAGIWGIIGAYVDAPPDYSGKCMYIGVGVGNVTKLESC